MVLDVDLIEAIGGERGAGEGAGVGGRGFGHGDGWGFWVRGVERRRLQEVQRSGGGD